MRNCAGGRSRSPYGPSRNSRGQVGGMVHTAEHETLVMKWADGESFAVLEANMKTKYFRIVYLDPVDSKQKVLVYDRTLSSLQSVRH